MSRGAKVLYCVYLALLMGFTGFVTLDTFVIARVGNHAGSASDDANAKRCQRGTDHY